MHPKANGKTKVTNRMILHDLVTGLDAAKGRWVNELPSILYAYRTIARTATKETPFSFVYGLDAVIPLELIILTNRASNFDTENINEDLQINLDISMELWEIAAIR